MWNAYAKVWSQIMTFFRLNYDGVFFVFAILELVGLFLGYVILLGLALFSSCYTVKGVPLAIALGH